MEREMRSHVCLMVVVAAGLLIGCAEEPKVPLPVAQTISVGNISAPLQSKCLVGEIGGKDVCLQKSQWHKIASARCGQDSLVPLIDFSEWCAPDSYRYAQVACCNKELECGTRVLAKDTAEPMCMPAEGWFLLGQQTCQTDGQLMSAVLYRDWCGDGLWGEAVITCCPPEIAQATPPKQPEQELAPGCVGVPLGGSGECLTDAGWQQVAIAACASQEKQLATLGFLNTCAPGKFGLAQAVCCSGDVTPPAKCVDIPLDMPACTANNKITQIALQTCASEGLHYQALMSTTCSTTTSSNPVVSCCTECMDGDQDGDGVGDQGDNCVAGWTAPQSDGDSDRIGDKCDACPNDSANDSDGDGVCDDLDNCPTVKNGNKWEPNTCWLVAGSGGLRNTSLVSRVDKKNSDYATNEVNVGTSAGTYIQSLAFHPTTGVLYGVSADRMGVVNQKTGAIARFPVSIGAPSGEPVREVAALAFSLPMTRLYAVVSNGEGRPDRLIQIDPFRGTFVKDAFGPGQDSLDLAVNTGLQTVSGLAVHPISGTVYIALKDATAQTYLATVDVMAGGAAALKGVIRDTAGPVKTISSIGFDPLGQMVATTESAVWNIDHSTAVAARATIVDNGGNYRGIDCVTEPMIPQADFDGDGVGDACDICWSDPLDTCEPLPSTPEPCPVAQISGITCFGTTDPAAPAAWATADVLDCQGSPLSISAPTDANGGFVLSGIPAGDVVVRLTSAEGWEKSYVISVSPESTNQIAAFEELPCYAADDLCPDGTIQSTGVITGYVCAPAGDPKLANAKVWVETLDCNGTLTRVETLSDANGDYVLTGVPAGLVTVQVEKGAFHHSYDLLVEGDMEVHAPQVVADTCFASDAARIAVVTGHWDSIEHILAGMGVEYTLYDGVYNLAAAQELLADPVELAKYDLLFFDCGAKHLDILLASSTSVLNLQTFVAGGGSLYASDWAFVYAEWPWPNAIDFYGGNKNNSAPKVGKAGTVSATVTDKALADFIGKTSMSIKYDLSAWVLATAAPATTQVHITGNTMGYAAAPLMMSFRPSGMSGGRVLYTTFHNEVQATSDMVGALQYLVFEL